MFHNKTRFHTERKKCATNRWSIHYLLGGSTSCFKARLPALFKSLFYLNFTKAERQRTEQLTRYLHLVLYHDAAKQSKPSWKYTSKGTCKLVVKACAVALKVLVYPFHWRTLNDWSSTDRSHSLRTIHWKYVCGRFNLTFQLIREVDFSKSRHNPPNLQFFLAMDLSQSSVYSAAMQLNFRNCAHTCWIRLSKLAFSVVSINEMSWLLGLIRGDDDVPPVVPPISLVGLVAFRGPLSSWTAE